MKNNFLHRIAFIFALSANVLAIGQQIDNCEFLKELRINTHIYESTEFELTNGIKLWKCFKFTNTNSNNQNITLTPVPRINSKNAVKSQLSNNNVLLIVANSTIDINQLNLNDLLNNKYSQKVICVGIDGFFSRQLFPSLSFQSNPTQTYYLYYIYKYNLAKPFALNQYLSDTNHLDERNIQLLERLDEDFEKINIKLQLIINPTDQYYWKGGCDSSRDECKCHSEESITEYCNIKVEQLQIQNKTLYDPINYQEGIIYLKINSFQILSKVKKFSEMHLKLDIISNQSEGNFTVIYKKNSKNDFNNILPIQFYYLNKESQIFINKQFQFRIYQTNYDYIFVILSSNPILLSLSIEPNSKIYEFIPYQPSNLDGLNIVKSQESESAPSEQEESQSVGNQQGRGNQVQNESVGSYQAHSESVGSQLQGKKQQGAEPQRGLPLSNTTILIVIFILLIFWFIIWKVSFKK